MTSHGTLVSFRDRFVLKEQACLLSTHCLPVLVYDLSHNDVICHCSLTIESESKRALQFGILALKTVT